MRSDFSFKTKQKITPLLRLLSGEQRTAFGLFFWIIMLKTSDLPVALFVFFKSLTQTFWFYRYIYLNLIPLAFTYIQYKACISIIDATSKLRLLPLLYYGRPVVIRDLPDGRPGSSEVPRNPLTRWDVSSIPANGIFLTKKLKNRIKMPNGWRTINSLVHQIRLHGRRGKGMAESFSREKLRHAPQKEGG